MSTIRMMGAHGRAYERTTGVLPSGDAFVMTKRLDLIDEIKRIKSLVVSITQPEATSFPWHQVALVDQLAA